MKEIKDDKKCFWIGRINIVKIVILPKGIYKYQESMELAQKQKYRSMGQHRKPKDKSTHTLMVTKSMTKKARIYNGKNNHFNKWC